MKLHEFEKDFLISEENEEKTLDDAEINDKYEKGESRIITEQGAIKLSLIADVFTAENYQLKPEYQRRITWDIEKRSKLIESFIMNVPIPPVFVYETEYDSYQVMDGLQRVSAIIDFYNDKYALKGLKQWPELNGRIYSKLPKKIKEGIDRRQLSVITLLKESSRDLSQENQMKKMVFERLNTGGVKLEDQEIRNALYGGPFNQLCIELSANDIFRKLWGIKPDKQNDDCDEAILDNIDDALIYEKNKLYRRMYDVEIVLRYFAMRHIDSYSVNLRAFLDACLRNGNEYAEEELQILKKDFEDAILKVNSLFGDKAFCQYAKIHGKYKWSNPQKMIYDPMMLAMSDIEVSGEINWKNNQKLLREFYKVNEDAFSGKHQSKKDIAGRRDLIIGFLRNEILV